MHWLQIGDKTTLDLHKDFSAHLKLKEPAADHSFKFRVQEQDFFAKILETHKRSSQILILFSS